MIQAFALLRGVAYLKRIAKALERIAEAEEARSVPLEMPRRTKLKEVWTPTNEQANAIYEEDEDSG